METYFVRHTKRVPIDEKTVHELYDQDRFFIHFPGDGDQDSRSLEPSDYAGPARSAITLLNQISVHGGYVWAQYHYMRDAKIGRVEPGTKIELHDAPRLNKPQRPAVLKTLRFDGKVQRIATTELMAFRACRPQQGTIARWKAVGDRLKFKIDEVEREFCLKLLQPSQQETVCAEFLRDDHEGLPRLNQLMMPVGRTLADVDIYAIAYDGKPIYAQVTNHPRKHKKSEDKIGALLKYHGDGHLLYFCPDSSAEDGITFVPFAHVEAWLSGNPVYQQALRNDC